MSKTITLKEGYVDKDGNAHKNVTIRCPRMLDDVEADKAAREAGYGPDSSYFNACFVLQCIEKWEGIPDPQINHVLSLKRLDFVTLRKAVDDLENEDMELETAGNEQGDDLNS